MSNLKKLSGDDLKKWKKLKKLHDPIVSTKVGKRGMVYVLKNGKKRLIHFGDAFMDNYLIHNDEKRRESYLKRAKGIRNKEGELTWNNPNYANYYSVKYLWNG